MSSDVTQQDFVDALTESAQIMFVTINGVYELHAPMEKEDQLFCEHCSEIGKTDVAYPCATTAILLNDMVLDEDSTSETSEPAESEEPSS